MNYFALAALELSLLGMLSGVVGTLIVLRRRSFFAVALSHATFPGGVLFAVLGYNLLLGQALFALLLVLIMTVLARVPGQGSQVASGVVLSFGFALGTLLAGLNPGLGIPVEALLVGSVLSVSLSDVLVTGIVLVLALACTLWFRRRILLHTFDPQGFESAGFRSWPIELIVSGVIAAGVVVSMPAVGAILGVAILIGPAAAARLITPHVMWIPPVAAILGILSGIGGLWASRAWDIAAGGSVGLATAATFFLALAAQALVTRRRGSRAAAQAGDASTGVSIEASPTRA